MFKVIESLVSKGEKELANSILNSTSNPKEVMSENPGMKNSLMKHSAAGSTMALYMTKVVTDCLSLQQPMTRSYCVQLAEVEAPTPSGKG